MIFLTEQKMEFLSSNGQDHVNNFSSEATHLFLCIHCFLSKVTSAPLSFPTSCLITEVSNGLCLMTICHLKSRPRAFLTFLHLLRKNSNPKKFSLASNWVTPSSYGVSSPFYSKWKELTLSLVVFGWWALPSS